MGSLILMCAFITGATEVEINTIDGRSLSGTLQEFDAHHLKLQTSDGPVSLEAKQLASFVPRDHAPAAPQPAPLIVTVADGSRLAAHDFLCDADNARITLPDGEMVSVAREHLADVRLQPLVESQAADWERIRSTDTTGDLLVVGQRGGLDYHRGVVAEVTGERVQFSLEGETLPVKRVKVFGIVFYQTAGSAAPKVLAHITDISGSRWAVQTVSLEAGELAWTTPSGVSLKRDLEKIVRLEFSQEGVAYLSDLQPESIEWTPYFGTSADPAGRERLYAPRVNQNLQSQPLSLGGQQYARGIAIHSRTLLVYRLPDRFQRFQATAGVDDFVRPRGNLRLVIRGDDRVLLDTTITGADAPIPVDLDISGARRVSILADFGDGLDVADHLVLADARFVR